MLRLAWAVSGNGHNLRATIEAIEAKLIDAQVCAVIVDRPSPAEDYCRDHGVFVERIDTMTPSGLRDFHKNFHLALQRHRPDWLALTFNRIVAAESISHLGSRAYNLHMALLPSFPGFGAAKQMLTAGVKLNGITIHQIDSGVDTGPIIAQGVVDVRPEDTAASLSRRQFEVALPLMLQITRHIANGDLFVDATGRATWKLGAWRLFDGVHAPAVDHDIVAFAKTYCAVLFGR